MITSCTAGILTKDSNGHVKLIVLVVFKMTYMIFCQMFGSNEPNMYFCSTSVLHDFILTGNRRLASNFATLEAQFHYCHLSVQSKPISSEEFCPEEGAAGYSQV